MECSSIYSHTVVLITDNDGLFLSSRSSRQLLYAIAIITNNFDILNQIMLLFNQKNKGIESGNKHSSETTNTTLYDWSTLLQ